MTNFLQGLTTKTAPIGIDITPEYVLIGQLAQRGQRNVALNHLLWTATPPGAVRDGRIENPTAIARIIQELLGAKRIKVSQAATAIPSREAVIRVLRLPAEIEGEELREVILNQETDYLPFPRSEAYVDYQPLEVYQDWDGIRRREILMVATPRVIMDSYTTTLRQAGLTPLVVDVAGFSLMRLLGNRLQQYAPEEAVALVIVQAEGTEISVLVKGIPQFSRSIALGTWGFRDALCRALDLPPSQAMSLLQTLTPSPNDTVDLDDQSFAGRGLAALRGVLADLAEEVQRSLDFYLSQASVAPLAQVILAGSGATLNQLDEYLGQRLSLPVERIDPFQELALFDEGSLPAEVRWGSGTVLGLCLRGLT